MTRFVISALMAFLAVFYGPSHVPYRWTHTLTPGCYWRETASVGLLDAAQPGARDVEAQEACFVRRGLASPSPLVRTILRRWPSEAELTAWRSQDATDETALSAPKYSNPILGAGRR